MFTAIMILLARSPLRFREWERLVKVGTASLGRVWFYGAIGLHQASFFDIFLMYCFFLTLMPLIVGQTKAGRGLLIVSLSAGAWLVSQFWHAPVLPTLMDLGYFNLFSWQLLFVVGLVMGYRQRVAPLQVRDSPCLFRIAAGVCGALFVLRNAHRLGVTLPGMFAVNLPDILTDKPTLGLIRILNLAAMAYGLWYAWRLAGSNIQQTWLGERLILLGRHSLQVFSWSVAVSYLMFSSGDSWQNRPVAVQLALFSAAILSLWLPAQLHEAWRNFHASGASRARMTRESLATA
jgi:hypothetical protein